MLRRHTSMDGGVHNIADVFDTTTGPLIREFPAGAQPDGLAVFPQGGRYSLGHTGNDR